MWTKKRRQQKEQQDSPLASRADVHELLEWELWRTFCGLYRHHWGLWPRPDIQAQCMNAIRQIIREGQPPRYNERLRDEWKDRMKNRRTF